MNEIKFNQFKDILKKYREGTDYQLDIEDSGNRNSGEVYEKKENYTLINSELRKEVETLIWGNDPNKEIRKDYKNIVLFKAENNDLYGNYICWEQGEKADKVIWKASTLTEEEKREKDRIAEEVERRRKEQAERDRKNREQFDRAKRGEEEFPLVNPENDKKCACCQKSLIGVNPTWGAKIGEREKFWFCSVECLRKGNENKDNDLKNEKCAKCGDKIANEGENGDYYNEWIRFDGKIYHPQCVDKKSEKEQKEINLNQQLTSLKEKLKNSSNHTEKSELENKIKKTEQELAKLKGQENPVSQTKSPLKKDIFICLGIIGTISALGLITFFGIKKIKKSRKRY